MSGRGSSGLTRRAVVGGMLAAPMIARGAAAQSGSGLTVTWGEDDATPRTYDPRVTSSRHEYQVIAQMFDTLIASDGSNKLFPGLATAWDVAPDGKSVTLKLRSDVGFHDGTPFDAEAVKFTFDTIADPKTASEAAVTQLGPYAGTEVIDPHTVRVNYSQPFGAALASYAEGTLAPVSPTAVKRLGNQAFCPRAGGRRAVPLRLLGGRTTGRAGAVRQIQLGAGLQCEHGPLQRPACHHAVHSRCLDARGRAGGGRDRHFRRDADPGHEAVQRYARLSAR